MAEDGKYMYLKDGGARIKLACGRSRYYVAEASFRKISYLVAIT